MRKAALIAMAAFCVGGTIAPMAAAEAQPCVVAPPGYDGYAPAYRSAPYGPYPWFGFAPNYSNFSPADCGYYNRRFYGAYIVSHRVRYVRRYYR
jgi:hypothetical protein